MRSMLDNGTAKLERSLNKDEVEALIASAGGPTNQEGGSYDLT
jgi:hypothetical protein